MIKQVCTRCGINKELSSFQGKNSKILKNCDKCREARRSFYQENKENFDPTNNARIYSPKEMSTALKELIYSIGQEENVENFDQGIAFVQTITTEDFDGSAKEIADNIKDLVCESDGYYYM
jgi:hypothetical protein